MRVPLALTLRRRPRARRALTLAAALVVGLLVARTVASADAVRAAWGPRQTVVVATRDLPPGHRIAAGDLRSVVLPAALAPDGAVDHVAPGRVVRSGVLAGEAVTDRRLGDPDAAGVAALLPAGTRAVAVPTEAASAPPLRVGQSVDLVAVVAGGGSEVPEAGVLAARVPVVAVGSHAATVAVPPEQATRVATALAVGTVTIVVDPAG